MSGLSPTQTRVSNTDVALIIYILYFVSYFTGGLAALIGVIMAHVQVGTADPLLATHYQFQIRTFWIGLFYLVLGTVLLFFFFIGIFVWLWWFIWVLIRSIKGVLALNEYRPIQNPASWLFG